jgi:hypothetical protein
MTVGVVALVLTGLIGVAHTRAGRPLLAMMGHGSKRGGCPLGLDRGRTPAERLAARQRFARSHGGDVQPAGRPALGFELDRTTRAEVEAWAAHHHIGCAVPRSGGDLECGNIAEDLLPAEFRGAAITTLWLDFGPDQRLVSVIAVRREAKAAAISTAFAAVTSALARAAGPPSELVGDAQPDKLSSGALRQASSEYRFRSYYALARATNMGDGYVLTEEYRSLAD